MLCWQFPQIGSINARLTYHQIVTAFDLYVRVYLAPTHAPEGMEEFRGVLVNYYTAYAADLKRKGYGLPNQVPDWSQQEFDLPTDVDGHEAAERLAGIDFDCAVSWKRLRESETEPTP